MSFFRNFPLVNYNFGDEADAAAFQNISIYIDLIDQITDDVTYYQKYTIIDGERPDTLSYKLYGTTDYYWTFFFINEKLRIQGWPLRQQELLANADQYYPHTVLLTDDTLHGEFFKGDTVATLPFNDPDFKGTIIEKNMELGQLFIKPSTGLKDIILTNSGSGYTNPPTVTITGDGKGATVQAVLDSDRVDAIVILNPGDGYSYPPTITVSNPDIDRGDRATATATILDPNVARGDVIWTVPGEPDPGLWDPDLARATTVLIREDSHKNSVHHYEDSNGEWIDFPLSPVTGKGANINELTNGNWGETPVTYLDRLIRQNDELSEIRVLKPSVVDQVVREFQRLLRQ